MREPPEAGGASLGPRPRRRRPRGGVARRLKAQRPRAQRPRIQRPRAQWPRAQWPRVQRPKAQWPRVQRPKLQRPKAQRQRAQRPRAHPPEAHRPRAQPPGAQRPARPRPPARPRRRPRRPNSFLNRPDSFLNRPNSFVRRHFLPPSALGIAVVVVLIGLVTGFTGAVLWANSDSQYIRQGAPVAPPPDRRPIDEVLAESEPTTTTKPDLSPEEAAAKLGPSVWSVETLDSAGRPVRGSAFLAGSVGDQGLLVTSLSVVEASTHEPAPEIALKGATFSGTATIWTWDEGRDLALLVVRRGTAPVPPWAGTTPPLRSGDKVFAVGGGGRVTPGVVFTVSPQSVEHNIVVDDALRGGPLVNIKGEVVAIASAAYSPSGVPTDTVYSAVPIDAACGRVLNCGGREPAAGAPEEATTTTRGSSTTRRAPSTTRRPQPTTTQP